MTKEVIASTVVSTSYPCTSVTTLVYSNDASTSDFLVTSSGNVKDGTLLSLFRTQHEFNGPQAYPVTSTQLQYSCQDLKPLDSGYFATLVKELARKLDYIFGKEPNTLELVVEEPLQRLATSIYYSTLITQPSTNSLAIVAPDKLFVFSFASNTGLSSVNSFPLSGQEVCCWKPCGDWEPESSGQRIVIGRGRKAEIWDIRSRDIASNFYGRISFGQLLVLRYFPFRHYFVIGGYSSGRIAVWDVRKTSEPVVSWVAHQHAVLDMKMNPSHERLVASCGTDGTVNIWDMESSLFVSKTKGHDLSLKPTLEVNNRPEKVLSVGLHSDSVYAVDWGLGNEFVLTSVGFDGKLAVFTIPQTLKEKILL
eukprot:jgi/Galph1/699/GphlegSOOS_G5496.1